MKRPVSIVIAVMLLVSSISAGEREDRLRAKIDSLVGGVQGTFAVAFRDLTTGTSLMVNADEPFHAASTMKTPVMIEVFRRAERGFFSLDDSLPVENSFKSIVDGSTYAMDLGEDSDDGLYRSLGERVSIRTLVEKMITVSSNLATNILVELVGAPSVTATMRGFGADSIRVLRGVEDGKAFSLGLNNTTTARDLAVIFETLARKRAATEASCDSMLAVLGRQAFRDMIPAHLPRNVSVAHKTGSITSIQHDSGIVTLPDGRSYVLVILSKGLKSNASGIRTVAEISKLVYDYEMGA